MILDTIRCYYREIGTTGSLDLIKLWLDAWRREGWNAQVLTPAHASQGLMYKLLRAKFASLPCNTNREFEWANFERWLAFAQYDGAVTDYDVFPVRQFPPMIIEEAALPVCGDPELGPGFIAGRKTHFNHIVSVILDYQTQPEDQWQGKPHICDMTLLRRRAKQIYGKVCPMVKLFGSPEWQAGPLVHYGNDALDRAKAWRGSKTETVRHLLTTTKDL